MRIIKGDILEVKHGIVCHQVNCMGKMGAGIALDIRRTWPMVYTDYMNAYRQGKLNLGNVIFSEVAKNILYVANLCGQYYYGRDKRYTDYDAVKNCLKELVKYDDGRLTIYIPKGMGCSLAGGNWSIVSGLIDEIIPNAIVVMKG